MDKERTGMLLLSKEDIKSVITMKDMIEADKQAFKMVVDGTVDTPLRTVINGKYDGAFLFMPAYAPELDAAAMKVINIFPHNIDNNLMTSPAQTMLIDGKTGYVIAMLDGTYVTQLRTGASSGAAFDLLGKKECKKGAMIGTGGQAAAQLEAMLAARKLEEVKIFDLNEERCKAFAEEMQKGLAKYGSELEKNLPKMDLTPIQTGFKFQRVNNWGGFINKKVFFVRFTKNFELVKLDFE